MLENFERGPTPATPESISDSTESEGISESEMDFNGEDNLQDPGAELSPEEETPELEDGDAPDVAEGLEEDLREQHENDEQDEDGGEAEEKRRRMEEIQEKVATGFELAKERMNALDQRYDGVFKRGRETLVYFKEKYPHLVSASGLQRLDEAHGRAKERFSNMLELYDIGSERLQTTLHSFPAEFMSREQIEMIDMQIDRLLETIKRGEARIEDRLDNFEMRVNALPSVTQKSQLSEREVKDAGEQLRGSEPLDEGTGEDLA